MKNIQFTGVRSAICTPLNDDGSVKLEAIKPMVEFEVARGMQGFYVCGSTGEGPSISAEARMQVTEAVVNACNGCKTPDGKTPDTIIQVAAPDTYDAFKLAKHAKDCGATAISSLAPNFYFAHTADEMLDYYKRLTACSDLPMIIYAAPLLTKSAGNLRKFFERAMEIDHVIGLKYTIRDYQELDRLKQINGGDINIINGPDETLLGGLAMGADGGIGSTYNLVPELFVEIYNSFMAGDILKARAAQSKANNIIVALASCKGGYLTALKNAMKLYGIDIGTCAYPCSYYDANDMAALKAKLVAEGMQF